MPSIQFGVNDMRYKYLIFSLVNLFGEKKKPVNNFFSPNFVSTTFFFVLVSRLQKPQIVCD